MGEEGEEGVTATLMFVFVLLFYSLFFLFLGGGEKTHTSAHWRVRNFYAGCPKHIWNFQM